MLGLHFIPGLQSAVYTDQLENPNSVNRQPPCRSHSELRKHKTVAEEDDIRVVSTKNCRSCCLHDGILHDGMHAETLKIHLQKVACVAGV